MGGNDIPWAKIRFALVIIKPIQEFGRGRIRWDGCSGGKGSGSGVEVVSELVTEVTSCGVSFIVKAFREMRQSGDDAVPRISVLGIPSGEPIVYPKK